MLEAVARAAADQQHIRQAAGGSRSGSRRSSCSHTGRLAPRSAGAPLSSGKRRSRKATISASAASVGRRSCVSGSTGTPCWSCANLTPRRLEVGEAVENVAAVEVRPTGHRAGKEAAVAGRRCEDRRLPAASAGSSGRSRRGRAWVATGRAQRRSGRRRSARPRRAEVHRAARRLRRRLRRALHVGPARRERTGRPASGPSAAPSARRSRARRGRSRIPSKSIIGKRRAISACVSTVGRKAEFLVRGDAVLDVRLFGREEEQNSARHEDRQSRDGAQRLPLRQRIPSPCACRSRPCRRRRGSGGIRRPRMRGCAPGPMASISVTRWPCC